MTHPTQEADAVVQCGGEPMPHGHYLTYQVARSHLCALAATATAEHLHDYWDVLDLIDSLHTPMQLVGALPVHDVSRSAMYDSARHAITQLSGYGLNPAVLLQALGMLDATWVNHSGEAVRAAP